MRNHAARADGEGALFKALRQEALMDSGCDAASASDTASMCESLSGENVSPDGVVYDDADVALLAPEGAYNDARAPCADLDGNVSDDASSLGSTSDVGLEAVRPGKRKRRCVRRAVPKTDENVPPERQGEHYQMGAYCF
jgi:hypothetical protein